MTTSLQGIAHRNPAKPRLPTAYVNADHANWRPIVDKDQRVMPGGELIRMILDVDTNHASIFKKHLAANRMICTPFFAVTRYAQHVVVVVHQ